MSTSMYGCAQRTCGRACPHAQTHTYTRIYTHTNWNTHTYALTYQGILLFFQCQFDTLFEIRGFYWKLIVGILWVFCWFFCCYETRKSILRLLPCTEVKPDAILVFPAFFPAKKNSWLNICTTQWSVVQILLLKEKLASWTDTQPTNPSYMSR